MSKEEILQFGNPLLRQNSKKITLFHSKFHQFLDKLTRILLNTKNAAGLAAPQIGILKQVSIINLDNRIIELINPEIIETRGEQSDYEGCLSFAGYSGIVTRPQYVKLQHNDRQGNLVNIEAEGFLARCLLHETDHLKGVLYIDHMQDNYLYHNKNNQRIELDTVMQLSYKNS